MKTTKLLALIAFAVCLAWPANAGDDDLEDRFAKKFGHGGKVNWDLAPSLSAQQREEICKTVHELTGYGPTEIKEAKIIEAYLKFSNSKKYKTIHTQVLSCKKNNKHEYTFYVTQGVDKNAITLIHPDPKNRKINGKMVFNFWWLVGQIRVVPTLQKLNA